MKVVLALALYIVFSGIILSNRHLIVDVIAQTFNPLFNVVTKDKTPSANSDITISGSQGAGEEFLDRITYFFPVGWEINSGSRIPDGAVIGRGTARFSYRGVRENVAFSLINLADTQGNRARWKINVIEPYCCQILSVIGNSTAGYSFTINPELPLSTPLNYSFTLLGSVNRVPIFTNPKTARDYTWRATITNSGGSLERMKSEPIRGQQPIR